MVMTLRTKIICLLTIPLIFILIFSINGITKRVAALKKAGNAISYAMFPEKIFAYVHEIQKERGFSAVFIGSRGALFKLRVKAQRVLSDIRQKELKNFLNSHSDSIAKFGTEFGKLLASSMAMMNKLEYIRKRVSSLTISHRNTLDWYSRHNALMFKLIYTITKKYPTPEMLGKSSVYLSLLEYGEEAGIERALLANAFALKRFGADDFSYFNSLLMAQDIHLKLFKLHATHEISKLFDKKMSLPVVREVNKIRESVIQQMEQNSSDEQIPGGIAKLNGDSKHWFKVATGRINILKEIADKASQNVNRLAHGLKASAQRELYYFFAVALTAVALFIGFGLFITHSISKPVSDLLNAAVEVKKGNLAVKVQVKEHDELGNLAAVFNQMTAQLDESRENMEHKIATKTSELSRALDDTRKQKWEIEKVNIELDNFVHTVSHDLRAPLRGIAAFSGLLNEECEVDQTGKEYLDRIMSGVTQANNLIKDLLTLSQISKITNPYETISVNTLINNITGRLGYDLKKKGVALKVQENMPTILCDRIKTEAMFLNLIDNAIKFSLKNNTGHPEVEAGYSSAPEHYEFYIKDNGIGIAEPHHDEIFRIFRRLHTAEEYEGTGAGLNIVKRIIEEHGWSIRVVSEPGKGACFLITVPRTAPELPV